MRLLLGLALSSLLFLQGCSSTSQLSPAGDAVYYALSSDATLRTWVDACKTGDSRTAQDAIVARQDWWNRNGALVEGADFGLSYGMIYISEDRAETGARLALAMTWNIIENAEKEVNERLKNANLDRTCQAEFARYMKGDFDLKNSKQHHQELITLQGVKQRSSEDLKMKQASVELHTGKEFGRSLFVVEKIAKRNGCPGADVKLLKNEWPNEIYGVSCPDQSYMLTQCEWGNCRILK